MSAWINLILPVVIVVAILLIAKIRWAWRQRHQAMPRRHEEQTRRHLYPPSPYEKPRYEEVR